MSRLPADAERPPGEIRVLRIFSRLNIGGPSVHVLLLTAGLRARGYDTRLVVGQEAPREGNLLDLAREKGVDCVRLGGLGREVRPLSDFRAYWAIAAAIRDFRPAVVHTHTAKAGLLGRVAARRARVPVVVHTYHGHVLRGYFGRFKSALYRALEKRCARISDALVAVSEAVRQDLADLGVAQLSRIRLVPLGLELEPLATPLPRGGLRREAGVPDGAPLIGIVGRLVPIKDVGTFLKAAAIVRNSSPDTRFAVVGDGEERPLLEEQARCLGLSQAVCFHGWRRDMDRVYGDLDIVANTSLNEGTPVALIEGLAAGRPVVATNVGGTPDVLAGGAHGALVPPRDPQALADAILDALQHPEAARRRAEEGRAHVLARHSVGRLLDDVDALYRELLEAKGRRP
jgi:glycosyltransferase involved in cell wall biosynthesis